MFADMLYKGIRIIAGGVLINPIPAVFVNARVVFICKFFVIHNIFARKRMNLKSWPN